MSFLLAFTLDTALDTKSGGSGIITVRAKHFKTTYFLRCSPTESALQLKKRIAKLLARDFHDVKLFVARDGSPSQQQPPALPPSAKGAKNASAAATTPQTLNYSELDGKTALDERGVGDDAVVYYVLAADANGGWEPVGVPPFELPTMPPASV